MRLTLKVATWTAKKKIEIRGFQRGQNYIDGITRERQRKRTPRTEKERETSVLVWNTILQRTHDWGAPEIKLIKIKRRVQ